MFVCVFVCMWVSKKEPEEVKKVKLVCLYVCMCVCVYVGVEKGAWGSQKVVCVCKLVFLHMCMLVYMCVCRLWVWCPKREPERVKNIHTCTY